MKKIFLILIVFLFTLPHCSSKKPAASPKTKEGKSVYYYLVSKVHNLKGEDDKALFYLDRSIKKNPGSAYLLIQKGYEKAQAGNLKEALKISFKAIKKDKKDAEAYLLSGKIYTALKNPQEAIRAYQKTISLNSSREEAYTLLSREYLNSGDFKKAAGVLKKQGDIDRDAIAPRVMLANIYATNLANYPKAIKVCEELLEINPEDANVLSMLVELTLADKDYKKALRSLQNLRNVTGLDYKNQIRLGLLYYETGNLDEAIRTLEDLSKKAPSAKIQDYLTLFYNQKNSRPSPVPSSIKAMPDDPVLLERLGDEALVNKNKKEARAYYEKAIFILNQKKTKTPEEQQKVQTLTQKIAGF